LPKNIKGKASRSTHFRPDNQRQVTLDWIMLAGIEWYGMVSNALDQLNTVILQNCYVAVLQLVVNISARRYKVKLFASRNILL
jgi:hypothetical protein